MDTMTVDEVLAWYDENPVNGMQHSATTHGTVETDDGDIAFANVGLFSLNEDHTSWCRTCVKVWGTDSMIIV